jgi:hypothetical protein
MVKPQPVAIYCEQFKTIFRFYLAPKKKTIEFNSKITHKKNDMNKKLRK